MIELKSFAQDIKNKLEEQFHIAFLVINENDGLSIRFSKVPKEVFKLILQIKNDLRLKIFAVPDEYGVEFLHVINKSDSIKRNNFCDIWKTLENNISLFINDKKIDPTDFKNNKDNWEKFELRFIKSPFYEDSSEIEENIINYVSLILSMMLSLVDYSIVGFVEGDKILNQTTKYERNPINRKLCLALKGYKCSVCGFDFKEKYGDIGKNFIEVHHALMVSDMGEKHEVDIDKELFPVCPNCHAMLHRKYPPYSIEELKRIIMENEK